MNGIQRFESLSKQGQLDKIPLRVGNYNVFLTYYYDISIHEYLNDPIANADAFVAMVREFDFDSIKAGLGYIFYGCGPETGLEWDFPDDNYPACTRGIITGKNDIDKIAVPNTPQGYFEKFLNINRRVKAELNHTTHLGVSILGPFSVMAFFRGFENILMDIIQDIELFNQLMRLGEEYSLFLGKECLKLDLHWANLMEIFLVPGVVSPSHYHRYIAPHDEKVAQALAKPPLSNYLSIFMGKPDDPQSQRDGKLISDYYFGVHNSVDSIRKIERYMTPGFPCQISISGDALVQSTSDQIGSFLKEALDYFMRERQKTPYVYLPSIQAENSQHAKEVAGKLRIINDILYEYK